VPQQTTVTAQFYTPPEDLRRYFTTFYSIAITMPDGQAVTDALHPEWANLRFFRGGAPRGWIAGGEAIEGKPFVATGPSSRCAHFVLGTTRGWGVGMLPLGWANFVGHPAAACANLVVDGHAHPAFAQFRPLADTLFEAEPDEQGELDRIIAFFRALPRYPTPDSERILAIHAALVDPQIASVGALVEVVDCPQRTIERICDRVFGFSPKLLLRRQRFMRSLTQFMLDPSLRWIGAIDSQYYDQAQFVRDFHDFMGTSPSEYAARPHPILEKFMHERMRVRGTPAQTLEGPRGAVPVSA
jgi:AraC-like DNA-binding protein